MATKDKMIKKQFSTAEIKALIIKNNYMIMKK